MDRFERMELNSDVAETIMGWTNRVTVYDRGDHNRVNPEIGFLREDSKPLPYERGQSINCWILYDGSPLDKGVWIPGDYVLGSMDAPTRDTWMMEERLRELGLHIDYAIALRETILSEQGHWDEWESIHCPAVWRCRAALEVVKG